MGNALTLASSSYQESVSKLQICNTGPDKTRPGNESVTYDTVENVMKDAPSNLSIVTTTDIHDSPVQELGIALTSSLNICDSYEYKPGDNSFNEQDETSDQDEIETTDVDTSITVISNSNEYLLGNDSTAIDWDESLDQNEIKTADLRANELQDFCSSEVFQFLDEVQVFPSVFDAIRLSSLGMDAESSTELSTPKLVSALKGSRALQGLPVTKLSVKWAPDVYDPPVTLASHTVKGNRRRSKFIKKDYTRQKHGKSKYARSGVSEKKHASGRTSSFVDPRAVRFEAVNVVKANNSSGLSDLQVLDHILPELKCGASFYNEYFSHLCLPVAEAS